MTAKRQAERLRRLEAERIAKANAARAENEAETLRLLAVCLFPHHPQITSYSYFLVGKGNAKHMHTA